MTELQVDDGQTGFWIGRKMDDFMFILQGSLMQLMQKDKARYIDAR